MSKRNQYGLLKSILVVISWATLIKFLDSKFLKNLISIKELIGVTILFIATLIIMFDLKEKYSIENKLLGKRLIILFIIYNIYILWGSFNLLIPVVTVSILAFFEKIK
ncbi:hypothetical protein [Marinitoga lauensis]|uniref:hypothetical protein n=1 Tax=Marinitoga lauensis TaxID=2201189 RepID=UPI0010106D12|nr:hypothetical protein [Marinitoga lauensis]